MYKFVEIRASLKNLAQIYRFNSMGRMGCLTQKLCDNEKLQYCYLPLKAYPFENNRSAVDITVRVKQKEKTTNLNLINILCNLFEIRLSKLIKKKLFSGNNGNFTCFYKN